MPLEEQLVLSSSEDEEDDLDERPALHLRSECPSFEEQLALSSSDEEDSDDQEPSTNIAVKATYEMPKAPVTQQAKKEATQTSSAHLEPVPRDQQQQCRVSEQKAEKVRHARPGADHLSAASKPKEAPGSKASEPKVHQVRQAMPATKHLCLKKGPSTKEKEAPGMPHGRRMPPAASKPAVQQQQSKAAKLKEEARKARSRAACPSTSLKRPAPVSEEELQRKYKLAKVSQEVMRQTDFPPALRNSRRTVPGSSKSLPFFVQAVLPVRRICQDGKECTPFVSSTGVKCTACRQRMAFQETDRRNRPNESFLVKVFIEKCRAKWANGRSCSYSIQRDGFPCKFCRDFTTVKEV